MWAGRAEFAVGSSPCSEAFSFGSPVFLPPKQKPTTPNSISSRIENQLVLVMEIFSGYSYVSKKW